MGVLPSFLAMLRANLEVHTLRLSPTGSALAPAVAARLQYGHARLMDVLPEAHLGYQQYPALGGIVGRYVVAWDQARERFSGPW